MAQEVLEASGIEDQKRPAQNHELPDEKKNPLIEQTKKGSNEIKEDYESRKMKIKENLEKNRGNPQLDDVFVDAKTDLIKNSPQILKSMIEMKTKAYGLTKQQIENVSIGILDRMMSNGILESLSGSLTGKMSQFSEHIGKGEWMEALNKTGSATKDAGNMLSKLEGLADGAMDPLMKKLKEQPKDPLLDKLLENPKEIAMFEGGDIKDVKDLSKDGMIDYLLETNKSVLNLDTQIIKAETAKNKIFEFMSEAPKWLTDPVFDIIGKLLKIPLLGDLIKGFLGKSGKDEEIMTSLKEDLERMKSIKNLRSYGFSIGKDGTKKEPSKDPEIAVLKDKDLSSVKHEKMKGFFDFCKKSGIDTTEKDFWLNVFIKKTMKGKNQEGDGADVIFPDLKDTHFSQNEPNDRFFEAFDSIESIQPKKEIAKGPSKNEQKPIITEQKKDVSETPKEQPRKEETKPQPALQESGEYPKAIAFDRIKQMVTIDDRNYDIKARYFPVGEVMITQLRLNQDNTIFIEGTKMNQFKNQIIPTEKVKQIFASLKTTGKYSSDFAGLKVEITPV